MPYDVAFRHQQALDPSALSTVAATLHAIEAAIRDCRNAGVDIETDPAVTLLARHLASICASRGDDAILRRRCLDAVADGFVLATRDGDHGLGFWNRDTGFGRLFDATVFTEVEAASFDVAVAGGAAEWLAMPAPLA